jgi:pyruvate dehydrogenase phosphatase
MLILPRDDLTVEVIFFGEGEATGNVTMNMEATASAPPANVELKAKL